MNGLELVFLGAGGLVLLGMIGYFLGGGGGWTDVEADLDNWRHFRD